MMRINISVLVNIVRIRAAFVIVSNEKKRSERRDRDESYRRMDTDEEEEEKQQLNIPADHHFILKDDWL